MDQRTFTSPEALQAWLIEQTGSSAAAARASEVARNGQVVSIAPVAGDCPPEQLADQPGGLLVIPQDDGSFTVLPQPPTDLDVSPAEPVMVFDSDLR